MQSLSINRFAGLSLMAGMATILLVPLILPGALIIDTVDPTNFRSALDAMVENATMTHITGLITMGAMALMALGLSSLLRLPSEQKLSGYLLKIGVGITLFAWGIYVVEIGILHMTIHIMTHGIGSSLDAATREEMSLTLLSVMMGVNFGFLALGGLCSFLVGISLAVRFHAFNVYVVAGYGLAAKGVADVVNLTLIQHLHDVDLGALILVSNALLSFGAICLFIIGYGIFRQRRGLVPEEA